MIKLLYDNISGNTGDLAIGLSLKQMFGKYEDFKSYSPDDTVIIGGGLLLRKQPSVFFDKFRLKGNHILNCMGVYGTPTDLHYLNDYKYLSVRSTGDKAKLSYLTKEVKVVPCTTMLLKDEHDFQVKENAIGIHLLPNMLDEEKLCNWANKISKDGFNIYFIKITNHVLEYLGLLNLSKKINNSVVINLINPLEIFSFIGKMKFMISCSLHGGIFAYTHNVPFILYDKTPYNGDDKMKWFMTDRNLQDNLFYSANDIINKFNFNKDYTNLLIEDKKVLDEHLYTIKCLI